MIKAWDADGHVSESEVTFSDKYWDPKIEGSQTEHYRDRSGWAALLDDRYPLFSGAQRALSASRLSAQQERRRGKSHAGHQSS